MRRRVAVVACFVVVTGYCAYVGRMEMFSGVNVFDDEGTILLSLRGYVAGAGLYGELYSRYGPFFFQFWGAILDVSGAELTHDLGRFFTLGVWLTTSLLVGASLARLTRLWLLGLLAQLVAFRYLVTLRNEPMHPGGLASLLVVIVVALLVWCLVKRPATTLFLVGAVTSLVLLVKVNVGVLLALALVCTAAGVSSSAHTHIWVSRAARIGFVLIPLVLMAPLFGRSEFFEFAVIAAVGFGAVALWTRDYALPVHRSTMWWVPAGAAVTAGVVLAAAILEGTSLPDLVRGIALNPRRQLDAIAVTSPLVRTGLAFAVIGIAGSLVASVVFRRVSSRPTVNALVASAAVRGTAGALIWFSLESARMPLLGALDPGLGHWVALAWVALVPRLGDPEDLSFRVVRIAVVYIAMLQLLQAYPVAGTQVQHGSFLLVIVGGLCFADALAEARALRAITQLRAPTRIPAVALTAMIVGSAAVGALVVNNAREQFQSARAEYTDAAPLDLPGARRVRSPSTEGGYRAVIEELGRHRCTEFLTVPGLNSLYLFTGTTPPVYLNSTNWTTVFDDDMQRRALKRVEHLADLCVVRNRWLIRWSRSLSTIDNRGVLERFIDDEFEVVSHVGGFAGYDIMVRA